MNVRRGRTPFDPVAASLRDAAADSGQMFSTICDAVSSRGKKHVQREKKEKRISGTTYQRGYRQSYSSALIAEAGMAEGEQQGRWQRCCWYDEDAYAAREAPSCRP
jgi:DNA relaxase NicK